MGFLDWIRGRKPELLLTNVFTTKEDPEPLFFANRQRGEGLIVEAFIDYSRASGKRFVKAVIQFSEVDLVTTTIGRIAYTQFVLQNGLPTTYEAEKANVARMIGGTARVMWEHKRTVHDMHSSVPSHYCTAYVREILK